MYKLSYLPLANRDITDAVIGAGPNFLSNFLPLLAPELTVAGAAVREEAAKRYSEEILKMFVSLLCVSIIQMLRR